MINLLIPASGTLQIKGTTSAVHTGYISYRIGKDLQGTTGQILVNHTGTGSAVTIFTNSTGLDLTIIGWSIFSDALTDISILVNSTATGNSIPSMPMNGRWTPEGIYTGSGQLISSGSNGLDAVISIASSTSRTIGTGSLSFDHASNTVLNWAVGSVVNVAVTASPTVNWVEGIVTSKTATNTTITVTKYGGSGTYAAWTISLSGRSTVFTEVRNSVALTANGTLTINATLNGSFTDHAIYTNQITGGTTENDLIDITNASAEEYFIIQVSRNGTAGTKTINFVGSGRTYNRSWLSGTLAIGINEKWNFIVRATSATMFDVNAQRVA